MKKAYLFASVGVLFLIPALWNLQIWRGTIFSEGIADTRGSASVVIVIAWMSLVLPIIASVSLLIASTRSKSDDS